jgi:L-threonylcarbamoyladenylate synthase
VKLKEADNSQFQQATRILRNGGLVIAPTETFYGILADARSRKAIERLVQLKERDYGNPIPLIAGDVIVVNSAAAALPRRFKTLTEEFWPGPLTLVLKAAKGFPDGITAGTETIGIRIPDQSTALDLAKFYRGPLTATSANLSGKPPARQVKELDEELVQAVDIVIDGGWTHGGQPSTVLDLTRKPPVILRPGILGKRVRAFYSKRFWELEG